MRFKVAVESGDSEYLAGLKLLLFFSGHVTSYTVKHRCGVESVSVTCDWL